MKLNEAEFNRLVTVPGFHKMLCNFDKRLYSRFVQELKRNLGVNGNIKSINWLIGQLGKNSNILYNWIDINAPWAKQKKTIDHRKVQLDQEFNGVFSIPRRKKIPANELPEFIKLTIKHEYVIIDDMAYVEYLALGDDNFVDKISQERWLLNKR